MAVTLNDKQRELIASTIEKQSDEKVLEVSNLTISFRTDNGKVQAVRGVSFDLHKGETLCIVGESGSGKSVTSKAIMGILSPNAIVEGGEIIYHGEDLLQVSEEEYHRIRGHQIGMIFQDPLSSLNPIVKIGKQIIETMLINRDQLKNYFNELIAPELTAYTNAGVVRDATIRKAERAYEEFEAAHKATVRKEQERQAAINGEIHAKRKAKEPADAEMLAAHESQETIKALKEKFRAVKPEEKAKIKAAKAEAKAAYAEKAPTLKSALAARKKSAKLETKQHAIDLKEAYEKRAAEIEKELAAIALTAEHQSALEAVEKKIKAENAKYACFFTLCYFLNKKKQKLRAKHQMVLESLKKERAEIPQVAEKDALLAEREEAYEKYRSQIKITKRMAKKKAINVMREVGIPEPEKRFKQYPFQFSGGMRQRIVIAIALIAEPHILICDEPTTALDVTIQAQILELINKLKAAHQMSVIFITHDLGVVANMADRVAVMYAGKIVEYGTDKEIFFDPRHPYTWALLSSIPDINSKEKLEAIPGTPPDMIYPPKGDAFALRNKYALAIDFKYEPPFFEITPTHKVASWLEYEGAPAVTPPRIVSERIYKALQEEEDARNGK